MLSSPTRVWFCRTSGDRWPATFRVTRPTWKVRRRVVASTWTSNVRCLLISSLFERTQFEFLRCRCARLPTGIDALLWRLASGERGNLLPGGSQSQHGAELQMVLQQFGRDNRGAPQSVQQQPVGQHSDLQAAGVAGLRHASLLRHKRGRHPERAVRLPHPDRRWVTVRFIQPRVMTTLGRNDVLVCLLAKCEYVWVADLLLSVRVLFFRVADLVRLALWYGTGPPEPVFNCTVSNHSSDAILIACQPGFHGGLPQNFSLHFYEESNSSGRLVLNQVFAEPLFLLSSLKTNMRYKASIASINAKGKSEDVIVEISTLKEPERQLEVKPGKSSGSIYFLYYFFFSWWNFSISLSLSHCSL